MPPPNQNDCPKCVIDGGALRSAATALAIQAEANAQADAAMMATLPPEKQERLRALSEYDCKLAAFLRERTEYIRLQRVGLRDDGEPGLYGGEYEGRYEIDVAIGIQEKR